MDLIFITPGYPVWSPYNTPSPGLAGTLIPNTRHFASIVISNLQSKMASV